MKQSAFGGVLAAALFGLLMASPAAAKTAKECRAEWSAHKAENKAKGVTEKAYVAKCRGETEKPKAAKKTKEKAAEKKAKESKETKKEKAAEKKESKKKAAKESKTEKKKAAASGKKTVKECEAEWRANKAANQAKGITEKAYVAQCRAGTAMAPVAAPMHEKTMTSPATAPTHEKKVTLPAAAPAQKMAAPATGKPAGANQYASEGAAKSHCRNGTVVWANLDSKIYHFAGSHVYGQTKQGAYMCEKDATAQGMRPAKNEKHP